jgi:hypothetical protein
VSAFVNFNIYGLIKKCRALLTASEKLNWPSPIDYASANMDDRKVFEKAFLNLLTLQNLSVFSFDLL